MLLAPLLQHSPTVLQVRDTALRMKHDYSRLKDITNIFLARLQQRHIVVQVLNLARLPPLTAQRTSERRSYLNVKLTFSQLSAIEY